MDNILLEQAEVSDALEDVLANDCLRLPQRPYDFSRGDRRYFLWETAVRQASLRSSQDGKRRVVRQDFFFGDRLYLVQVIGS